jgi:hypothetical protein
VRGLIPRRGCVAPNPDGPDGSATWTPDAFGEADLRDAAEHIPSLRIVGAGRPAAVEVGDADLATLVARAKPPRARPLSWLRLLAPADARTAADASPSERAERVADPTRPGASGPRRELRPPTAAIRKFGACSGPALPVPRA